MFEINLLNLIHFNSKKKYFFTKIYEIFHKTILTLQENINKIIDKSLFCYVDLSFIVIIMICNNLV